MEVKALEMKFQVSNEFFGYQPTGDNMDDYVILDGEQDELATSKLTWWTSHHPLLQVPRTIHPVTSLEVTITTWLAPYVDLHTLILIRQLLSTYLFRNLTFNLFLTWTTYIFATLLISPMKWAAWTTTN